MKRNALLDYNRLPMEKAYNVRELGGYAARGGSVTKYHQFLRTDNLTDITEEDKNFLLAYGLQAVIDLRGREETLIYPNPFREHPMVSYINLPFITDSVLDMRAVKEKGFQPAEFYINLVEYKEMVARLFRFILEHVDGCVLFHCQAGKDRTGILAMLLLGICDVSKRISSPIIRYRIHISKTMWNFGFMMDWKNWSIPDRSGSRRHMSIS